MRTAYLDLDGTLLGPGGGLVSVRAATHRVPSQVLSSPVLVLNNITGRLGPQYDAAPGPAGPGAARLQLTEEP